MRPERRRRSRRRGRPPRIEVAEDSESVFRDAILAGVLSAEPAERLYAGHYLYMFHDEEGTA